jgi:exosortase A
MRERSDTSLAAGAGARWPVAVAIYAAGIAAVLALLYPTVRATVDVWTYSASFRHCFLILPVIGYLIVERFPRLRATPCRPSWTGVALFALAAIFWRIGHAGHVGLLQQLALVFMIQSLWLATFGWAWLRAAAFPLIYLLFLVPVGTELVPALQNVTAHLSVSALRFADVPVYLEGTLITIPAGSFEVAEACAGLRFLVVTVAIAALVAGELAISWPRRALILAAALIIPILANAARVFGIIMIADRIGYQYATGVDHLIYGWIFLSLVLLLLLAAAFLIAGREAIRAAPVPAGGVGPGLPSVPGTRAIVTTGLCLAILAGFVFTQSRGGPPPTLAGQVRLVATPAGWQPTLLPQPLWRPRFDAPVQEIEQAFERDGVVAVLYAARFETGTEGGDVTASTNRPEGANGAEPIQRDTQLLTTASGAIPTTRLVLGGADQRTLWITYWIGDRFIASRAEAALWQLWQSLVHGRVQTGVLVVSINAASAGEASPDAAAAALIGALPLERGVAGLMVNEP